MTPNTAIEALTKAAEAFREEVGRHEESARRRRLNNTLPAFSEAEAKRHDGFADRFRILAEQMEAALSTLIVPEVLARNERLDYERRILAAEVEGVKAEKAMRAAAAHKATGFLVGDPVNGVPLRSPSPLEISDAILELPLKLGNESALPVAADPDLGKIERGHTCKHGIRWPHACQPCDDAAWAATNPGGNNG